MKPFFGIAFLFLFFLMSSADLRSEGLQALQWGHEKARVYEAWQQTGMERRGHGVRVMLLDTGVDKQHPSLEGQIEAYRDFVSSPEEKHLDTRAHGTHVAALIAGLDRGIGSVGVAPGAKLLVARVCAISCQVDDILKGLHWAIEENVDIVHVSFSSRRATREIRLLVEELRSSGALVVAPIGNNASPRAGFPAGHTNVFAVGAIKENNRHTFLSNWGQALDLVAPGQNILSAFPRGQGRRAELLWDGESLHSLPFMDSALSDGWQENDVVYVSYGRPQDFAGRNVQGKLALMSRGENLFIDKYHNAAAAGARGVLLINSVDEIDSFAVSDEYEISLPYLFIAESTGLRLKNELATRGLLRLGYQVSAWDYQYASGTSVATPYVSGVAALLKSLRPSLSGDQIKAILRRSAKNYPFYTLYRYGFGQLDAEKAVKELTDNF